MERRGFVSYISEEESVAAYVKEWLTQALGGELHLFVSSLDLLPGRWLDQLRDELARATFVLPLLSDASRYRPWLAFEAGCAFIAKDVELIPLLHRGMRTDAVPAPFNFFQTYDLTQPGSVGQLLRALGAGVPDADCLAFAQRVLALDRELSVVYDSLQELATAEELRRELSGRQLESQVVKIDRLENWDELELRTRVVDGEWIEASGQTSEAMGFNLYEIPVAEPARWLIVEARGTENTHCDDMDKFVKIAINRAVVKALVPSHRHYNDNEFSVKSDGFVAYALPPVVGVEGRIASLSVAFWKANVRRILLRFHIA